MNNELIGIIGMMCILTGFLLNQVQKWKHDSIEYDTINLVGSVLLTVYSVNLNSMPFFILNTVWAAVSLKDIYKFVKLKK